MGYIVSKNSRQKTERRHKREQKREQKQKRRNQKQYADRQARIADQITNQPPQISFDKSAWSTLQPPINTVLDTKPKPVLTPNQGFDIHKWKPNEVDPQ